MAVRRRFSAAFKRQVVEEVLAGAAAAGQKAEDLFLYPAENVTLAAGETGYYPLFTESVPYSEFYE